MRKISYQTPAGNIELEVSDVLIKHVATRNGIPSDAVSDMMLLHFFRDASDGAMARADQRYLDSNGTDS